MIIAREKLKTNIAEYILYMWQIEDIIRSMNFSIDKIKSGIIDRFDQPPSVRNEMLKWYTGLIHMMQEEQIYEKGHLVFLTHKVNELNDFHKLILLSPRQKEYQALYKKAKPAIGSLIEKGDHRGDINEVDVCLTGLYGLLMLKLQKKEITAATLESMQAISALMAMLSAFYMQYDKGELDLEMI